MYKNFRRLFKSLSLETDLKLGVRESEKSFGKLCLFKLKWTLTTNNDRMPRDHILVSRTFAQKNDLVGNDLVEDSLAENDLVENCLIEQDMVI